MKIGHKLKGGETIELIGDLGAGKTAFVRGLARGLGSADEVRSPSFTLSNQYRAAGRILCHFDFYRLQEPGIMRHELEEVLTDSRAVVVVEWPRTLRNILPKERLTVGIVAIGENSRRFDFSCPAKFDYLLPTVSSKRGL